MVELGFTFFYLFSSFFAQVFALEPICCFSVHSPISFDVRLSCAGSAKLQCGAPSKVRRICQPCEGRRMKPCRTEAEVGAGRRRFATSRICQPCEGRRMKPRPTEAEVRARQRSFATSRGYRRCGAPSKVRRICQTPRGTAHETLPD